MVVLSSFAPPTSGVRHLQPFTAVVMNSREIGKGTLYITESNVLWLDSDSASGFTLEYKHIPIHAVSRDPEAYPRDCLYVMVDTHPEDEITGSSSSESDDNEVTEDRSEVAENQKITHLRFIPDDNTALENMFKAMSECQTLHPDPEEILSDDDIYEDADEDGDEGEYYLADEEESGLAETMNEEVQSIQNGSNHHEPMDMDEGQFEDADDVNES